MSTKTVKRRNQIKSRFYYYFWGAATLAVVSGQWYVGSGYRQMSRSINRILDATIQVLEAPRRMRPPTGRYYPLVPPAPDDADIMTLEEIDPYIYLEEDGTETEIQRYKIVI